MATGSLNQIPGYENVKLRYVPYARQPKWMQAGLCAQADPDLWFPDTHTQTSRQAIKICKTCPFQQRCRDWAISREEDRGIWGGMNMKTPEATAEKRIVRAIRYVETGEIWINPSRRLHGGETNAQGYITQMIDQIRADATELMGEGEAA